MGYYLADGIYPNCATLVKTISLPQSAKKKVNPVHIYSICACWPSQIILISTLDTIQHFEQKQEAVRKDVQRAFGVLQARFAIICGPARMCRLEDLKTILKACNILHNMIVEDQREEEGQA